MSYPKTKDCAYGCGTEIYWSTEDNAYFEVDSDQKHRCPNYQKGGPPKTETRWDNKSKPSTFTPKTKEEPKKMENSYEHLTGSPREILIGYERLSDIVRDAGGKIHGSQRGTDDEGKMDLMVYYEVPISYRANVKESMLKFWRDEELI